MLPSAFEDHSGEHRAEPHPPAANASTRPSAVATNTLPASVGDPTTGSEVSPTHRARQTPDGGHADRDARTPARLAMNTEVGDSAGDEAIPPRTVVTQAGEQVPAQPGGKAASAPFPAAYTRPVASTAGAA